MFNLGDLMEMFEGNERRDDKHHAGKSVKGHLASHAYDEDDDDDRHHDRKRRNRHGDDDEGGSPFGRMFD